MRPCSYSPEDRHEFGGDALPACDAAGGDSGGRAEPASAAQLAALQARMNPHFLFNALNTVAAVVRSNPSAAERVVENLSDVLRQTLQRSAGSGGTVAEEIEYVRAYLSLEQERWGSPAARRVGRRHRAQSRSLPPLVLQPLVENALRHGIGSRLSGGTIRITVQARAMLTVRVNDDGPGFPGSGPKERASETCGSGSGDCMASGRASTSHAAQTARTSR